ncbi:Asp23/Gls24 family envelope stress response protein [Streptomyces sp. NBC_00691]|uniref:Asp23/Gls24 family envelope stress response protein n=1 Tax=Streptomyces sp. NBC_00691 TaxID=2903671 RepID=UPI002E370209|nr:Asp23/Gls24 family envelope stress response protein [Streptomyces sp. NBC_00691]
MTATTAAVSRNGSAPQKGSDGQPSSAGPGEGGHHDRPAVLPVGERGRTAIGDVVVVKVAGMAAREIPGVHDMGGGLSRTLGVVRERVPGGRPNVGRGVKVEVGERQAAIDLELVVEYGVAITDVAQDVRENVVVAVERITGLEVVEVNITVNDVHLPEDDNEALADSRVE